MVVECLDAEAGGFALLDCSSSNSRILEVLPFVLSPSLIYIHSLRTLLCEDSLAESEFQLMRSFEE